jgi:DNA-binding beta-propeller fold protein YncE
MRTAAVVKRIDVGPAPFGVAFSSDGSRIVVSGGEQEGAVWIVDARRLEVRAQRAVGICPRTVAVVPGEDAVWVTLNGADSVVRLSTRSGRITRSLDTPALPDRVAVSPDGRALLVSHGGRDARHISELDVQSRRLRRHRAGRLPSGVGWTRSGRKVVALGGSGQIVVLGGKRHTVGGAPRGLAVRGNRAWTVDALTGAVAEVRA